LSIIKKPKTREAMIAVRKVLEGKRKRRRKREMKIF